MLAQIVLTPAESKKLIAKAVAKLEAVQQATKKGIVAFSPTICQASGYGSRQGITHQRDSTH